MRLAPPLALAAAIAAALATGCASVPPPGPAAVVTMESRSGSSVTGSIRVSEAGGGLRLVGEVRGLKPGSEHGFHIHDKGDCSAPDASSAGGHFNPAGTPHGRVGSAAHHAGDMPNLRADGSGVAKVDVTVPGVTLQQGGAQSAAGRSLVVHRDPDDYTTQPAGNSGPRVACGVITPR
jgi:Cu-Zn family superoxide dismutase